MNNKERRRGSANQRNFNARTTVNNPSDSSSITRRNLLILGGGAAIAGLVGLGTCQVLGNSGEKEASDEVYLKYLRDFEMVATGDPETEDYLAFFKERRKQGEDRNGQVVTLEAGDSASNFWTAVVPGTRELTAIGGIASFIHNDGPAKLVLKDIDIHPLFSGVLLAHEAVHVKQWLTGYEQSREDGFILGELDAYTLEFKLLDKATQGKFSEVSRQQSKNIAEGKYRGRLSDADHKAFAALFPTPISEDDYGIRVVDFTIGINLAAAETRASNPEEAVKAKTDYIRAVYNQQIPILGQKIGDTNQNNQNSEVLIF